MGVLLCLLVGHARVAEGVSRRVFLEPVQAWRSGLRYHHENEAYLGLLECDLNVQI